jgi:hypothetical protein
MELCLDHISGWLCWVGVLSKDHHTVWRNGARPPPPPPPKKKSMFASVKEISKKNFVIWSNVLAESIEIGLEQAPFVVFVCFFLI